MHPVQLHALAHRQRSEGQRAFEAIFRREARAGVGDHGFARHSEQERLADRMQRVEARKQGKILRLGFPEADARIEHDPVGGQAGDGSEVEAAAQPGEHTRDRINVGKEFAQDWIIVHEHDSGAGLNREPREFWASRTLEAVNVVQKVCARFERGGGNFGFVGVYRERERRELRRECANNRGSARDFFGGGDFSVAGARGLPTDIEQVRPLGDKLPGAGERRLKRKVTAAVEKRVVGDVQDTHQPWHPVERERETATAEELRVGIRRRHAGNNQTQGEAGK